MIKPLFLLAVGLALPAVGVSQTKDLRFTDPGWEFQGGDTKTESFLGESALLMRMGRAIYRDVEFMDGTIEFDLAVTPHRAFAYLQFRMESDEEYEDLYFRSHKSELPDAIQYSPVYRGASNWQLYHTEGYTAATPLPPGQWIHVKVEMSGPRAAVFVDDMETPKMVIPLARDPKPGYVAVRSFLPVGSAPDGVSAAAFANVVVRPGQVTHDFADALASSDPSPGVVEQWAVSDVFAASADPLSRLDENNASRRWQTLPADASGLLVLGKHLAIPQGVRPPTVLARLRIRADRAMVKRLNLGYSDDALVALNGAPIVYLDDSYRFNLPRRQGLIGLEQAAVYLPLVRGDNELVVAIADVFGGWGVMGRFPDQEGIEIIP